MATLGITCGQLRREIGRFLGFDRDPANWTADEIQDVWDVMDAGLRSFYRPPRIPGDVTSHQWSFLKPHGVINTIADQDDYDMPDDFAGLDGGIYFEQEDYAVSSIQVVNEARILQLRQQHWYNTTQYHPQIAAVRPKKTDGISQQRHELMVWPTPDESYQLRFKYHARQDGLRDDNAVPLGGPEHAECIRAACLAAAEAHLDDELGPKQERFMTQLIASVDYDRRVTSPQNLGYNHDPSNDVAEAGYIRSTRLTTYDKFPA